MEPRQAKLQVDPSALLSNSLLDPPKTALATTHAHFAIRAGKAWKYPREVAPFAALNDNSREAMGDLLALLQPGETTYVVGSKPPKIKGSSLIVPLPCLQMWFPPGVALPSLDRASQADIVQLSWADAAAMVNLTDAAYPGFFRVRTCEMGRYYGVWEDGRLVAMAGERLCLNPLREISGVCTLPEHRQRGLARSLIARVMHDHRCDVHLSWLHVVSSNRRAVEMYLRMGFQVLREVHLHGVRRTDSTG